MSRAAYLLGVAFIAASLSPRAAASDHLDTPTVIADPAADIGDLYAWMSPDGRRLNLVMDIVGKRFSDHVAYVFHVDSGRHFGRTAKSTTIACRFDLDGRARCDAAGDHAAGVADGPAGIESDSRLFRVFAGLRDDPFANNVRGTRQAYEVIEQALKAGAVRDAAGCPALDAAVSGEMLERWRHTDGGPAKDFLAGWHTGALVVSIDIGSINRGGAVLAVWAGTYAVDAHIGEPAWGSRLDRMGRTLTGNALVGLFDSQENANRRKEQYNRAAPQDWNAFVPDIQKSLALYDAFDGVCGNQWLASPKATAERYSALAHLLADDRLWVDSRRKDCKRYMAVERGRAVRPSDCGGRTPVEDAVDVYRSLLVNGSESGVEDGVLQDDKVHSVTDFPFLAAP